jgi:hypothetical protein
MSTMRRATFGVDIRSRAFPHPETARLSPSAPNELLLIASPTVSLAGRVIVAHLPVTNPTSEIVSVVVVPVPPPLGGNGPFTLRFDRSAAIRYTGPLFPPAPPVPVQVDFPPETEVTFEAKIGLANWTWSGTPTVALQWSFHFVSGTSPGGSVSVDLPEGR